MIDPDVPLPHLEQQIAIAPVNQITVEDVGAGAARFDAWLLEVSGGWVNLERIQLVAGSLPVVGNIMALVDVLVDIVSLAESDAHGETSAEDVLLWVSLGINLIGIIPLAPAAAARMSMRTSLHLVRQELRHSKGALGDAVIELLIGHLVATHSGAMELFVQEAERRLGSLLDEAGKLGVDVLEQIADGLVKTVEGELDATGDLKRARQHVLDASDQALRDPGATFRNIFAAATTAGQAAAKGTLNQVSQHLLPDEAQAAVARQAQKLRGLGPVLITQLDRLKDVNNRHSIASLVKRLAQALAARKARTDDRQGAQVKPEAVSQARRQAGEGELEAVGRQTPATARARDDKNCVCPSTANRISFALGSESFSHSDFSLPGPFPLTWTRTYDSRLDAYDEGCLGARWITPFTTRLDQVEDGLVFHDTDGHSHAWPLPKVGGFHYDAIEYITLVRGRDDELTLCRGFERQETYRRHGVQYLLTQVVLNSGAGLLLRHAHRRAGQPVLSELVTWQDDPGQPHRHLRTTVDDQGRLTGVQERIEGQPPRLLCTYRYDDAGDLVQAQDEHRAERAYRYHRHLVTRYTDRTGRGLNLQWQGEGADAKAVREWADDGSFDTRLQWDPNIRLTCVTDALGQQTWHYYDDLGYTYRIRHPDGRSEWLFRDRAKNIVRHVHPDGTTDRYRYDERSNLLQHIRADHSEVHYAYDDQDRLLKTRDAEGGLWLRDYDARGHLQATVDPLGNTTRYTNNVAGLPVAVEDAKGNRTRLSYNAAGQLTDYTDCSGKQSVWTYDAQGQLILFTDALGQATRYSYRAGQLCAVSHPDQTEERFERDAEGRLLAHIDPLGQRTAWSYSQAGLLSERLDAARNTLRYSWDRLGRLKALENENHRRTEFHYDPLGRLLQETGFDGRTTRYQYREETGTLARILDGGREVTVTFDALGRLVERHARAGDQAQRETFVYDGNGRLVLARNEQSLLEWFHDGAGNLLREHQHYLSLQPQAAMVWRHEYDALNQRTATVRPDGHRVSWLTYGSGHLQALRLDEHDLLGYERDDLHRETARHQGNHLRQTQTWDPAGRIAQQWLGGSDPAQFSLKRVYHYDVASRLTHLDDSRRAGLSYQYDPVGRLLAAHSRLGQETFRFDPAGNLLDPTAERRRPLEQTPVREALLDNVLRSYAGQRYEYDERGNQTRRWKDGKPSELVWDLFDRLVGYRDERLSIVYGYDPLGRRLYKKSTPHYRPSSAAGSGWNQMEQQRKARELGCNTYLFGWDGDTLAWESTRERPGIPGRTVHYLYEPGSFVPVAQGVRHEGIGMLLLPPETERNSADRHTLWQHKPTPRPFNAMAWYHCDALGTPLELTDPKGHLAWSGEYYAWGRIKQQRTASGERHNLSNPLRFQGQYHDHETGLHYNRHRYYDPDTGRFLSKDPIGLLGGTNLYAYAPNPVGWVDPSGLSASYGNAGRKPLSAKPNQNSKCPCRKEWEVTRYNRVCEGNVPGVGYAKYFYDAKRKTWWSPDKTGHGESVWKVYNEQGSWRGDADIHGDIMSKHKSTVGKEINFKNLKCKDMK